MYTYNKNDKSYTFSSDDIDLEKLIDISDDNNNELDNNDKASNDISKHKKIEVIDGGNDLDISPASNYIEIEKPKNEKKENVIIPEDNK